MLNANKQSIKCDSIRQTRWCLRTRKRHLVKLKRRKILVTTHLKRNTWLVMSSTGAPGSPSCRSRIVYDIIYGSGEEKNLCKALKRIFYSHTKRKIIQSALAGEKREIATSDTLVGPLVCLRREVGLSLVLRCFRLLFPRKKFNRDYFVAVVFWFFFDGVSAQLLVEVWDKINKDQHLRN